MTVLCNARGGVWPGVTKRYMGVGGCPFSL